MAGNTQMNDSERGVFSFIYGVTGYLVATALLLSILAILTVNAISVQAENAEKFYKVNQDLNALKMNSTENINHRTMVEGN